MATTEVELINAICSHGAVSTLMDPNLDDYCGDYYGDVIKTAKAYYSKYRSMPDISILTQAHPDLEVVEATADPGFYLDRLSEEFLNNRIETIIEKTVQFKKTNSKKKVLERMQQELGKLNKYTGNVKHIDLTDVESAEADFDKLRERSELMGGTPGLPTGIEFIDASYMTGLAPGHLVVNIGWPGKGKTWLSSYIACNVFLKGYTPLMFSMEMTGQDMRARAYTQMGSGMFSASGFARGDVDIDNFRTWADKTLGKGHFHVESPEGDTDVTPNYIQGKIEQYKPDIVFLDYAQLMMDNRRSEGMTPRMMNLSRETKRLAVANNIPVVLITAATAEESSDRNEPPTLDKVAWSKAIEYDADMAFATQRHEDSGLIEVVGRKNRHGMLFSGYIEADLDRGIWKERFDL